MKALPLKQRISLLPSVTRFLSASVNSTSSIGPVCSISLYGL
jgi:hypothetical protein